MFGNDLQVGVYQPHSIPQSFKVYVDNIQKYLQNQNIKIIPFHDAKTLPKIADVLWDIRSGGGNPPLEFMLGGSPLVITVHGFAPISLSGWEYFGTFKGMIISRHHAHKKLKKWQQFKDKVAALIAVSNFTKSEAAQLIDFPADKINVCYHSADSSFFTTTQNVNHKTPYFFHISNGEPRKNIDRIVRAFRIMRKSNDVELLLKLPEQEARSYQDINGVRIVSGFLTTDQLAKLYQHALAFLFPSLYEGFGIPILEAMACGCPVITSNVSACPEVAGESALIIDPRDEQALLQAMEAIYNDQQLRNRLIELGIRRAFSFSWEKSAICHAEVFRIVAGYK